MMLSASALLLLSPAIAPAISERDHTAATLQLCLDAPTNASTGGQTECEGKAAREYDRRLNTAYVALMRELPANAAARLRVAQRAWLLFQSADDAAHAALFATREGTMYVPMQAGAATNIIRDRALQLENDLRVLRIEN